MNAVLQTPPAGAPMPSVAPGGIQGKPPGGFVYPYWLPQIPGTIEPKPQVVEPPHDCPTVPITSSCSASYWGSGYDDSISSKLITGKGLRDCEIKYSHLEDCTVTDCLLIGCTVNGGSLSDVELRSTKVHKSKVHDCKAIDDSRFGVCTISEGDITRARFYQCSVSSSEVKESSAWISRFSDATIRQMTAHSGCEFTDCGGDVPKVPKAQPAMVAPVAAAPIPIVNEPIPKADDCPKAPFTKPSNKTAFSGSRNDTVIKGQCIINQTLTDCEVHNCYLEGSTLTDCLVVECQGNGTFKDVELRNCQLFKADLDDVKAVQNCRFGNCTIANADLQNGHYSNCLISASEVTNGIAWDTKFRDATLKNVKPVGKCKFSLCGGDVPKKDDSSDDEMGEIPTAYNPNPSASSVPAPAPAAVASPPAGYTYVPPPTVASQSQPAYQQPTYGVSPQAYDAPPAQNGLAMNPSYQQVVPPQEQGGYVIPQFGYAAPPN